MKTYVLEVIQDDEQGKVMHTIDEDSLAHLLKIDHTKIDETKPLKMQPIDAAGPPITVADRRNRLAAFGFKKEHLDKLEAQGAI